MKRITYQELKPGMVLAKPIYFFQDSFWLNEGVKVTPSFADKIKKRKIAEIFITEEDARSVTATLPFLDKIPGEAEKRLYLQTYLVYQQLTEKVLRGQAIELQPVRESISEMLNHLLEDPDVFLHLTLLKTADAYTSIHSINVAILSILLGFYMGYNKERLIELGTGALLHDVGKLKIPPEILNKPGFLTNEEFSVIKKHTDLGVELVKKVPNVTNSIIKIIRDHHERGDGSGYYRGLTASKISTDSKIVAVADIYDALTADRSYRRALLPHQAAEILMAYCAKNQLDEELAKRFIYNVTIYPLGCVVELSNNTVARVIGKNKDYPLRPLVEISYPLHRQGEVVDLAARSEIAITGIVKNLDNLNDDAWSIPLERLIWKTLSLMLSKGELNCCELGQYKIVAMALHELKEKGIYLPAGQPVDTITGIQQEADVLNAVYQAINKVVEVEKH